jgi:hypothetical protein
VWVGEAMLVTVVFNGARAVVSTLAGGVSGTNSAYADASGTNAGFNGLVGVVIDVSGNLFACDRYNQRIRKVTAGGGTQISPGTRPPVLRTLALKHRRDRTGRSCIDMNNPIFRSPSTFFVVFSCFDSSSNLFLLLRTMFLLHSLERCSDLTATASLTV